MSDAPRGLDPFAEYIRRRHEDEPGEPGSDAIRAAASRISVRQFRGPRAFNDALAHLRIAHLTDLHVGRVTPIKYQYAAVDLTNAAQPDLVAITGDFVCHSQQYLDELEAVLKRIRAPIVAVLGNHDYWSGADEVRSVLKRAGALVLDNANSTVTLRGQSLQLVGLDDAYTGHADRAKALAGLRRDVPTLGLSHIAEEADALWAHGVPLVLSGHTHAGQITLARLHEISIGRLAGHKYVHGLYGARDAAPPNGAVYVGAGIGASVMPLRLGDRGRREVAVFELGTHAIVDREHHAEQPALPGRKPSAEQTAQRHAKVLAKRDRREKGKK